MLMKKSRKGRVTRFKILVEKKTHIEIKVKENTVNPKSLWKTLKQLGLPEKKLPCTDVCLKTKEELKFDPFTISELLKKLYSNLTNDLVLKFPVAVRKFDIKALKKCDNDMLEIDSS